MGVMLNQSNWDTALAVNIGSEKEASKVGVLIPKGKEDGLDLPNPDICVITGFDLSQAVNAMVTSALGGTTYIYGFGDNPSKLNLNGMVFQKYCSGGVVQQNMSARDWLDWYDNHKYGGNGKYEPMFLSIAGRVFETYILASSLAAATQGTYMTINFGLQCVGALQPAANRG